MENEIKNIIKEFANPREETLDNAVRQICALFNVVGSADFENDTIMTDEEIDWHEEQQEKALKSGMTREQLLNGDHNDIIF